jgi:CRISPR-associated protein Csb3
MIVAPLAVHSDHAAGEALMLAGDIRVAFSHLAAVGLATILEESGVERVTLYWTRALEARAIVGGDGLDWNWAAKSVHAHAVAHAADDDWTAATAEVGAAVVGLLSPRIKPPADDAAWVAFADQRYTVIDDQLHARRHLDLAMIGALGEPAYWRFDDSRRWRGPGRVRRPDEGASRWEMKTRNRGEDFVAHRLRKLALAVADREPNAVRDGLSGAHVIDEVGADDVASRTATGLASPGPADNALAWCALWGISSFPVTPRLGQPSRTAGYLPKQREAMAMRGAQFYLPVPAEPVFLARYRHVALSEQLATAAATTLLDRPDRLALEAARNWLLARHIGAVARFPIGIFGSASAPERRALLGTIHPLGG